MKKIIACGLVGATLLFSGCAKDNLIDESNTSTMPNCPELKTINIQNDKSNHDEKMEKTYELKGCIEHNNNGESKQKFYEIKKINKQ